MKIGSLFSGAGGLDMAVEAVFGARTVWHCEIDPAAAKVLAARQPDVPNLGDITQVDWTEVEPVDIACGGFPCQDVSPAGRRAGIRAGTRSGLWAMFADAIAGLRPRIVVIENVRGLLSAEAHRAMESSGATMGNGPGRPVLRAAGAVLGDLASIGYDAQWATVAASDIGAPHRRERVFIIATDTASDGRRRRWTAEEPVGDRRAVTPDSVDGHSAPVADTARNGRHEGWPESARFIRGSDAAVSGNGPQPVDLLPTPTTLDHVEKRTMHAGGNLTLQGAVGGVNPVDAARIGRSDLLPTPLSSDGKGGYDTTNPAKQRGLLKNMVAVMPTPQARDWRGGQSNQPNLNDAVLSLLPTPQAKNAHGGADYARMNRGGSGGHDLVTAIAYDHVTDTAWGKYGPAIRRWEALTRLVPSPTEPNTKGNPRLNPAFSEWMLGWPAGWVTEVPGISRNDRLRIIGNGVCPQQAAAALTWLLSVAETTA